MPLLRRPGHSPTVLLVIDLQVGVLSDSWDADGVVHRTTALIERARAAHMPVIWVQDEDDFPRTSNQWELAPPLLAADDEARIHKVRRDAFIGTELAEILTRADATRLVLAGAHTDYCIITTLYRAAIEGYGVTLVGDCHTTRDITTFATTITAQQIIGHTNATIATLRYPGQHIAVANHDDPHVLDPRLGNLDHGTARGQSES